MNRTGPTAMRWLKLAAIVGIVVWGAANWSSARQARLAGAAFHKTLSETWRERGSATPENRQKLLAAAARFQDGDFRAAAAGLVSAEAISTDVSSQRAAAGRFFAQAQDLQKRFSGVVEAAKTQENDPLRTAAVRTALAQAMAAAAAGDAQAVQMQIEQAENALDPLGTLPSGAAGGNTAAEVAGLLGRIGPAYDLGRELLTEGHAAIEKLIERASREFKAGRFERASPLLHLAASLLGVETSTPAAAVVPQWFDALATAPQPVATQAEAQAAVDLCEAMVLSEAPAKPVSTLVEKARRELDAGRPSDAYWWANVALNALGMSDEAVAAATGQGKEGSDGVMD